MHGRRALDLRDARPCLISKFEMMDCSSGDTKCRDATVIVSADTPDIRVQLSYVDEQCLPFIFSASHSSGIHRRVFLIRLVDDGGGR